MNEHASAPDVAVNILTRLAAEDLTVAWLSKRTGLEQSFLQRVLDGAEVLTLFAVILIADALETTVPKLADLPKSAVSLSA